MTKPLVLCIMDGVGISSEHQHNAVANADMPCFKKLLEKYPHSVLHADGEHVGLKQNLMGNSEVGHITIGGGRVVQQYLLRFQKENWNKNEKLQNFIKNIKSKNGIVHFAGLMSDGCVHSNINDELTIIEHILNSGLRVCIHFVADGRDTPPQSARHYIDIINARLKEFLSDGRAFFGTVSGRYYTMDRNNNTDRTQLAYDAIVMSKSEKAVSNINEAIQKSYDAGINDEFIIPTVITSCPITKNDGFVWGNYRSDRSRQIVRAIVGSVGDILTFSQYGEGLNESCPALLDDVIETNSLGDVLEQNNLSQLRIAETEKYNHVTYFFDLEKNVDYKNEEKVLIPSPNVATFDMKPEMSAIEITDALLQRLNKFDVVILNYANGDMVGHTGNENAAVHALEILDTQLSRLVDATLALDGTILITADHGNAEKMWDFDTNSPWTAHTTNPVNFILVSNNTKDIVLNDGGLADIAPTMLDLLKITKPSQMNGVSLIAK